MYLHARSHTHTHTHVLTAMTQMLDIESQRGTESVATLRMINPSVYFLPATRERERV